MTDRQTYQTPSGELPPGLLAAAALKTQSPGLPKGISREKCIELAIAVHRKNLTPADEQVLRFYARCTDFNDWPKPGRGPVAYVAQRSVAEALNLTRRSIYRAERNLERLGLIVKLSADNGRRYGPQGDDDECCGLYFSPMIAACEDLLAASAEAAEAREMLMRSRKLASSLRFRLRRLAHIADDLPESGAALEVLDQVPSAIMSMTDIAELDDISAHLVLHIERLEARITGSTQCQKAVEKPGFGEKMSRAGDSDVPRHIQTTTKNTFVKSNPKRIMRTASNEADANLYLTAAYATEKLMKNSAGCDGSVKQETDGPGRTGNPGRQIASVSGDILVSELVAMLKIRAEKQKQRQLFSGQSPEPDQSGTTNNRVQWSLGQLYGAASVSFRALLDASQDAAGNIPLAAFSDAAETMCHVLGINRSAWTDACMVMGQNDAALAVLIIDRNLNHPTNPVHSPGGALRGMTARAREGKLRLDASVFAIIDRDKKERLN